jgi:hypothetical protein
MDGIPSNIRLSGKSRETNPVVCQIQLVSIPHHKQVQGLRLPLSNRSTTVGFPFSTFHLKKEADPGSEMSVFGLQRLAMLKISVTTMTTYHHQQLLKLN